MDYRSFADGMSELAQSGLEPHQYCGELLRRILPVFSASAGAIWGCAGLWRPELFCEMNTGEIYPGDSGIHLASHWILFKRMVLTGKPLYFPPFFKADGLAENISAYWLLVVPIRADQKVMGMIELWKTTSDYPVDSLIGEMRLLDWIATLASAYPAFHCPKPRGVDGGEAKGDEDPVLLS